MSDRDPFLELQDALEKDLAATGFNPDMTARTDEPRIDGRLSGRTEIALKDLYDDLLNFYDYLSDQITRYILRKDSAKARIAYVRATTARDLPKSLSNAEARKAYIESHDAVVTVICDHLYFKQMHESLEERRRKISKSIERVSRELYLRNSKFAGPPPSTGLGQRDIPNKKTNPYSAKNFKFTATEKP
jgi:hypothetical protein